MDLVRDRRRAVILNRDIADVRSSRERTRKALDATVRRVAQIAPLSFWATREREAASENRKATGATNEWMHRIIDTFGRKLDTAIDSIKKVGTQVLSSNVEEMADKALFRMSVASP